MSGAVLYSRFFDETSDQWQGRHRTCVHAKGGHLEYSLWIDNVDLSISVAFNVTCLTVTSLITKQCQQCWPIHSCSFYKVVRYQIWGMVVDFRVHLVVVNFCLQQWKSYVVSFTGYQFDSGLPTRSLSSPTRHVPPANRLTSLTSCKTTDQPKHYDHRINCYCSYRGWR